MHKNRTEEWPGQVGSQGRGCWVSPPRATEPRASLAPCATSPWPCWGTGTAEKGTRLQELPLATRETHGTGSSERLGTLHAVLWGEPTLPRTQLGTGNRERRGEQSCSWLLERGQFSCFRGRLELLPFLLTNTEMQQTAWLTLSLILKWQKEIKEEWKSTPVCVPADVFCEAEFGETEWTGQCYNNTL